MITTLSNGVRLSDHHPYGRTWVQFIHEEANKDALRESERSEEYRILPVPVREPRKTFRQWFSPFNPLKI